MEIAGPHTNCPLDEHTTFISPLPPPSSVASYNSILPSQVWGCFLFLVSSFKLETQNGGQPWGETGRWDDEDADESGRQPQAGDSGGAGMGEVARRSRPPTLVSEQSIIASSDPEFGTGWLRRGGGF